MPDPQQKYKIIEKLDSGGMAEIYRGEAESIQGFKKQVAIKRVLPHLTKNKRFVAMFLDEARLSLYLDHATIVHVFDIGFSGNTVFIVMEFIAGETLCEALGKAASLWRVPPSWKVTNRLQQGRQRLRRQRRQRSR